jgi:hypothetical protein
MLAGSEVEAQRMVAEATAEAQQAIAEAGRIVDAAEQTRSEARTEAAARLKEIAALELRAAEAAEQLRQLAVEEASAARLQARQEIIGLLAAGREERRRAEPTTPRPRCADSTCTCADSPTGSGSAPTRPGCPDAGGSGCSPSGRPERSS